jgi:Prealbumin-like fold domain
MAETRTATTLEGANLTDLALGDLKTCAGAVAITKNSPKGPVEGVTFNITGGGVDQTAATDANGVVCFPGLDLDVTYTVTETVPDGFRVDSDNPQTILVDQLGTCESGAETLSFDNIPLADIQVRFRDGGSGLTALDDAGITCNNQTGDSDTTDTTDWDDTLLIEDIDIDAATVTITCTIPIDP